MQTPTHRAAPALAGLACACIAGMPAHSATERPVFVCRSAHPATHPVTFSDRPCGPAAETRVLRVHDPGPGSAATIEAAPARASARPAGGPQTAAASAAPAARPDATDDRCRRLHAERDRLDDRMRAGYSAREAAQLWNRWREADAKIYAARC